MGSMAATDDIAAILDFWFNEETKARWYESTQDFDQLCKESFGALLSQITADDMVDWECSAEGALALCILLDQLPRNIYRGRPRAFAHDKLAIEVARRAADRGLDRQIPIDRRQFLYMPFMHSEEMADQDRALILFAADGLEETMPHAVEHADIIRRFGRFPHRNKILGRESTTEELEFLKEAKNYGQSYAEVD
jgi:uncharacterized protein (DUF924 family)